MNEIYIIDYDDLIYFHDKVVYIRKIKYHKVLNFTNDKNTITKFKKKLRAEKANK